MSEDCCMSCGHIRYLDDPFRPGCEACCEWALGEILTLRANCILAEQNAREADTALTQRNAQLAALEGAVCHEHTMRLWPPHGVQTREIDTVKLGALFDERQALKAENTMLRDRYETELTEAEIEELGDQTLGPSVELSFGVWVASIERAAREIRSRRPA